MAVNYYAVLRMTWDIDVAVELSSDYAERLRDLFQDDSYIDREAARRAARAAKELPLFHNKIDLAGVVIARDST